MGKIKQVTSQELFNIAISSSLDIDLFQEKLLTYLDQIKENKKLQAENLYLDFKSAQFFQNFKSAEVKKDIASFANSEGGLIIYGIDEAHDYLIESCQAPKGSNDPADAIRNGYQSLAPYIYPKPRTYSLNIEDKVIVVIAIPRSETLVPISIQRSLEYFLRIGSSTGKYEVAQAPNYLVEDLISQRRNRPSFVAHLQKIRTSILKYGKHSDLTLEVAIENTSFNWIEEGIIGIVYYQYSENKVSTIDQVLPRQIEIAIDIDLSEQKTLDAQQKLDKFNICIVNKELKKLTPFNLPRLHSIPLKRVSLDPNFGNQKIAMFIAPKDYPPSWFQIEFDKGLICDFYYIPDQITNSLDVNILLEQVTRPIVSVA